MECLISGSFSQEKLGFRDSAESVFTVGVEMHGNIWWISFIMCPEEWPLIYRERALKTHQGKVEIMDYKIPEKGTLKFSSLVIVFNTI